MTKAKTKRPYRPVQALILWDLKLRGDINEGHKGGNASKVMIERIREHSGHDIPGSNLVTALNQMQEKGLVKKIVKNNMTYVVRLTAKDAQLPSNPYSDATPAVATSTDLVPYVPAAGEVEEYVGPMRELPLTLRMGIISSLSASTAEDLNSYKDAVSSGL